MTDVRLLLWTEERLEELRQYWSGGKPASAIALEMGLSRNAVLGKVHRLGLEGRRAGARANAPRLARLRVSKKMSGKPFPRSTKQRTAPVKVQLVEPVPEHAKTIRELTFRDGHPQECRWIVGPTKAEHTVYCGTPTHGQSWCGYHRQRVERQRVDSAYWGAGA